VGVEQGPYHPLRVSNGFFGKFGTGIAVDIDLHPENSAVPPRLDDRARFRQAGQHVSSLGALSPSEFAALRPEQTAPPGRPKSPADSTYDWRKMGYRPISVSAHKCLL
jgi:hypothetical protein